MRTFTKTLIASISVVIFTALFPVKASEANPDWEAQVRKADEAFWNDFNFSPSAALNSHYADDVEFYHDLGGTLIGKDALAKVNAGMDSSKNRGRRVLVPGTLRIYPMRRNGTEIYGALVMGEHEFFSTESGKIVKKTVRSIFTHLLLLKDGAWKIARIYSYDHQ
jgi:hypothetical protein